MNKKATMLASTLAAILSLLFFSGAANSQVPVTLGPAAKATFLDNSGKPLAGGLVFTYIAGTSTPQATYTDSTGTITNANPIVLDSAGRANIWFTGAAYKIVVQTSGFVTLYTVDNFLAAPFQAGNNNWTGNETHAGTETFNSGAFFNAGGAFSGSFSGSPTMLGVWNFSNNAIFGGTVTVSGQTTLSNGVNTDFVNGINPSTGLIISGASKAPFAGGPVSLNGGNGSGTATAGGNVSLVGGNGTGTAGGGAINILAGNPGPSSVAPDVTITAGNAVGAGFNGGNVIINSGVGGAAANAGEIVLSPSIVGANIGKIKLQNGIDGTGTGVKHTRVNIPAIGAGDRTETLVTWPGPFADASYTAVCSVNEQTQVGTTQSLVFERTLTQTATQVGVVVFNGSGSPLPGVIDCIGMHD